MPVLLLVFKLANKMTTNISGLITAVFNGLKCKQRFNV